MSILFKTLSMVFLLGLFAGPVQSTVQKADLVGIMSCDNPAAEESGKKDETTMEEEPDCD